MATVDNDADDEGDGDGDATVVAGADETAVTAAAGGGGGAQYADGPRTRMNLFTAINAGLRAAMETDDTAVRDRITPGP